MKKRMSWYWAVPGATGLALIMAAVMLLVSTAGHTPTASAQTGCVLSVTKTANVEIASTGPEASAITYTITVDNTGTEDCTTVTVTDNLPADLACASTTQTGGFTPSGCAQVLDETVTWSLATLTPAAAAATLTLVANTGAGADEGDLITNTAVAAAAQGSTGDSASVDVFISDCDLSISKDSDDNEVGEGGEIVYTITVDNANNAGDCADVVISETIPDDTDCIATSISNDSDVDINAAEGCDSSGTVTWDVSEGSLDGLTEDQVAEVTMTVELTSGANDGDEIDNEACVTFGDLPDDFAICDTLTVDVSGVAATATPTVGPTPTRGPTVQPVVPPPVAPPVAVPLPTIAPPITGTGPGGGSGPLALGLALVGVCLLLVSGAAMVKRTR
jgi:uncharacterized repeat protein (TIGR01451 family)/fimbrial isopeptide formation D2 family protein